MLTYPLSCNLFFGIFYISIFTEINLISLNLAISVNGEYFIYESSNLHTMNPPPLEAAYTATPCLIMLRT